MKKIYNIKKSLYQLINLKKRVIIKNFLQMKWWKIISPKLENQMNMQNTIKPPLEEPEKIGDTLYFERRRPPKFKWQPIDEELREHKKAKLDPVWQIDVNQQEKKVHSSKRTKRLAHKRKQK